MQTESALDVRLKELTEPLSQCARTVASRDADLGEQATSAVSAVTEKIALLLAEREGMANELLSVYEQLGIVFDITRKLLTLRSEREVPELFLEALQATYSDARFVIVHGEEGTEDCGLRIADCGGKARRHEAEGDRGGSPKEARRGDGIGQSEFPNPQSAIVNPQSGGTEGESLPMWIRGAINDARAERRVCVANSGQEAGVRPDGSLRYGAEALVAPVFAGDSFACAIVLWRGAREERDGGTEGGKGTEARRHEGTKEEEGRKGGRDEGTEGNPQSSIVNRQSSIAPGAPGQSPIPNPQSAIEAVVPFHSGDMMLLDSLSCFCGDVVRNLRLLQELQQTSMDLVRTLVNAVDQKDPYTSGHSNRVGYYATLLGREVELEEKELRALEWSALLHDVGKIGIRDEVLKKAGKLTEEEFQHIKEHPVRGYEVVRENPNMRDSLDGVLYHHEHFDGKGYPEGLKGTDIPLQARIIQIADIFDALTTTRSYRAAFGWRKALVILGEEAGTVVDPDLSAAFARLVNSLYERNPGAFDAIGNIGVRLSLTGEEKGEERHGGTEGRKGTEGHRDKRTGGNPQSVRTKGGERLPC
ncbi:MAG: HD-GYP domain-containing protein [Phycisphaerae bacterium]